ncbi:MAG: hypothetical protein PWQ18_395, partial [Clostridia bacterium]|nr:hypothetical protein [Clostridia bacterium]
MATRVVLPQLGITTTEGLIGEWYKKEGDPVGKGEALFSIETDKVTTDVEATADGVLRKILVPAGQTAAVTTTVAIIAAPDEDITPLLEKEAANSVTGVTWGQPGPAPAGKSGEAEQVHPGGRLRISPLARKIAAAQGISEAELRTIPSSGPGQSLTKRDIEAYLARRETPVPTVNAAREQLPPAGGEGPARLESEMGTDSGLASASQAGRLVPLTPMRRTIAQRLTRSHQETPTFYLKMEVEAARLQEWRQELNARLARKEAGLKLTLTDFFVKASAQALQEYPGLNVSYTEAGILYHEEINIGIATALPTGLVVPVIKNAAGKSLAQLARERVALVNKARAGDLTLAEMSGGTFTVSNLGMYPVDEFRAIINPPEAAILAVGRLKEKLYLEDGNVKATWCVYLGLTADHRVIDGATAAGFLQAVKGRL